MRSDTSLQAAAASGRHNTSHDCWVSFFGKVYDLTPLLKEYDGPLAQPIIAAAGSDISFWFDEATGKPKMHVNPDTGLQEIYCPWGRYIHAAASGMTCSQGPESDWGTDFAVAWWENPRYLIGLRSARTRKVNLLTKQKNTLEVPVEETVTEIQERYLEHNAHAGSYTWKRLGKPLNMEKTLAENGMEDETEETTTSPSSTSTSMTILQRLEFILPAGGECPKIHRGVGLVQMPCGKDLVGKPNGLAPRAVDNAVSTIKEVLTFRLQEAAVDAILNGKRKGQSSALVKRLNTSLQLFGTKGSLEARSTPWALGRKESYQISPNMVFVLTVHEDADDASLSESYDQILRIHGLGWNIPAVFVNVLEGSAASKKNAERWEDSLVLWTRDPPLKSSLGLGVAESLRNLCQPVYGIAAEGLNLPGLLVLDACDYVLASKPHAGTLVNRVVPRHLIGETCQEIFNDVVGTVAAILRTWGLGNRK
eukprot:s1466_g6.t1